MLKTYSGAHFARNGVGCSIFIFIKHSLKIGMSRESIVFIIGALLVLIPYLGIPDSWKATFFLIAGLLLMFVGYSLRRSAYLRSIKKENGERSTDSFVESVGQQEKSEQDEFNTL